MDYFKQRYGKIQTTRASEEQYSNDVRKIQRINSDSTLLGG